jgi:thiamine-monophosphate kinase
MARELQLLEWLRRALRPGAGVQTGIGDDMAVLSLPGAGTVLFASDMILDGTHFDIRKDPLEQIGRKALACNLSDCAAMAARPVAAVVSLALPPSFDRGELDRFYTGMLQIAAEFETQVVGGDLAGWASPLAIDVAIIAVPWEGIAPVRRAGAVVGDRLYVTGLLGGSREGHHLSFTPRVREARTLAASLGERLHAMMDISDGLSLDLHRVCAASGVGAVLDEGLLEGVVSPAARRASAVSGGTPLDHVLGDGEDFELLLAVAGAVEPGDVPLYPVGEVTANDFALRCRDGHVTPLEVRGYTH